ncbi:hypothetical protein [Pseudophaeobacter flagellatus]|uniref:hypothetical protein n=1 Tax=Pseudophaeobacter flagellatus TaxID=2899119 RepID=UPI001E30DC6B|nr:hypothetical protein [Pseudophaeobacter flagellatus]MCD9147871.1 hypothetical protein [Pseudophaeobacter flagellatus]
MVLPLAAIPVWAWFAGGAGVGVAVMGAGAGAGSFVAARNISEGLEDGLRIAVPVGVGALVVYAAYQMASKK